MINFVGAIQEKALVIYDPKLRDVRCFLEKMIDSAYKRAFESVKYQAMHFNSHLKGRIFALIGTSTAGKSSIIEKLCKMDPKWVEKEFDSAMMSYVYSQIKRQAPKESLILDTLMTPGSLVDAVYAQKPPQLPEIALIALNTIKEMKKYIVPDNANEEINAILFTDVVARSYAGDYVILDHMDPQPLLKSLACRTAALSMKMALAYCPFHQLLDRTIMRNHVATTTGNEADWRSPINPLLHFASLYTSAKPGDTILECLTRVQVEETFERAFKLTIDYFSISGSEEVIEIANRHDQNKQKLLEGLGFIDGLMEVSITPKFKGYHYLFNTSILKPEESAATICSWL